MYISNVNIQGLTQPENTPFENHLGNFNGK